MFGRLYIYVLALGFAFLPFTRGLTVDIGFPLKAYEPLFALAVFTFALSGFPVDRPLVRRFLPPLLLLVVSASISFVIGVYSDDRYGFDFRGGPAVDGLFRLSYLVFNILLFVVCYRAARVDSPLLTRAWLLGMLTSLSYSVYCALSLTATGEAYMLPGIERHQVSDIGPLVVSRSGTFEEGNFGGFYFLLSAVIALRVRSPLIALLAVLGVILSKSTSAYFGLLVAGAVYVLMMKRFRVLVLPVIGVFAVVAYGLTAWFIYEGKFSGAASSSGAVRLNEVVTAWLMFRDHMAFGVGLGQYGFLYPYYLWDVAIDAGSSSDRHIPNNVYMEFLAETGLVGLGFAALFWSRWLASARRALPATPIFLATGMGMMTVWLAYPTFNIAFLWCFMGFGLAASDWAGETLPRNALTARRGRVASTDPSPGGA